MNIKNCKCHCHNDHEGAGLDNPEFHCKCLPNCEHCNPVTASRVNKGMEDVELLHKIDKALYLLSSNIEDIVTEYLGSEPSAENRVRKNMDRQKYISEAGQAIRDAVLNLVRDSMSHN